MFGHEECIWGDHLVNFQADHSELIGVNYFEDLPMMISLIEDAASSVEKVSV